MSTLLCDGASLGNKLTQSVEGLMTVGFSGAAVYILPDWPSNTKWLTQEERDYAVARIQAEKDTDSAGDKPVSHWRAFVLAVTDWRVWLVLLGQNMATAGGTITLVLASLPFCDLSGRHRPTLGSRVRWQLTGGPEKQLTRQVLHPYSYRCIGVQRENGAVCEWLFTGADTQQGPRGADIQMTVPIYCVSLVFVIFTAFTSDYSKDREWHLVGLSLFAVMCLAIVAGVHDAHVRYAFLALGESAHRFSLRRRCMRQGAELQLMGIGWGGIQSCVLLNFAYMGNSFGRPAEKRAVAIGLIK